MPPKKAGGKTPITNQCVGYDITIAKADREDYNDICLALIKCSKMWVFQEEVGATGYEHYQIRLSLKEKCRLHEAVSRWRDILPGHWTVTTTDVHKGQQFNYVMKEETRVAGPWKDEDYEAPPKLTRQLREFMEKEMRLWQSKLLELINTTDDRSILVILDEIGNAGKSIMAEWLEFKGLGWELPMMNSMEDIMQCVCSLKAKKCYMVDMPRGMKKNKLAEFYAGIETLKNGCAYDKRYSFRKMRMDRPQIVVFTNKVPDTSLLTRDRWYMYRITEEYDLEKHSIPDEGGAGSGLHTRDVETPAGDSQPGPSRIWDGGGQFAEDDSVEWERRVRQRGPPRGPQIADVDSEGEDLVVDDEPLDGRGAGGLHEEDVRD